MVINEPVSNHRDLPVMNQRMEIVFGMELIGFGLSGDTTIWKCQVCEICLKVPMITTVF